MGTRKWISECRISIIYLHPHRNKKDTMKYFILPNGNLVWSLRPLKV